jgi:Mrp family chromosome partitioning ATPase
MTPRGLGEVARRLEAIVEEASQAAEFVVIDTPPVAEISDALTFAGAADDVLLVCRIGRTPHTQLETARDLLERTGVRPAGLVLVG